jgi:hypothetical protein
MKAGALFSHKTAATRQLYLCLAMNLTINIYQMTADYNEMINDADEYFGPSD